MEIFTFVTSLDRETILKMLKERTCREEDGLLAFMFGNHYFAGEVTDKKVRIRNVNRNHRNPSPVLDIFVDQREHLTEVVIRDNSKEAIAANNLAVYSIAGSSAAMALLIGSYLSYSRPEKYSMPWILVVTALIVGFGFVGTYVHKRMMLLNTKDDLAVLAALLKGK